MPFGHSQRSLFCAAAQGLGHRREASARWAVARSAKRPKVGSETSGGRGQRPPRRLSDRESAPNPGKARREACALWALGPKAQSDPQRGSETMSATVREARMIEQPGMGPARKRAADKQVACTACPPKARRKAPALWAVGPKAQSDPKRGSETMSTTERKARMIEQPGRACELNTKGAGL